MFHKATEVAATPRTCLALRGDTCSVGAPRDKDAPYSSNDLSTNDTSDDSSASYSQDSQCNSSHSSTNQLIPSHSQFLCKVEIAKAVPGFAKCNIQLEDRHDGDGKQSQERDLVVKATEAAIKSFIAWLDASGQLSSSTKLWALPREVSDNFARISGLVAYHTSLPEDVVSENLWETIVLGLRADP